MSESDKYEDRLRRQMEDLPLPDMNSAWQQMERKLDDEDRKRRLLPPFVLNCLGIALGLLLLLAGAWYFWWNDNAEQNEAKQANKTPAQKVTAPAPGKNELTISSEPPSGSHTETASTEPQQTNQNPTTQPLQTKAPASTTTSTTTNNSVGTDVKSLKPAVKEKTSTAERQLSLAKGRRPAGKPLSKDFLNVTTSAKQDKQVTKQQQSALSEPKEKLLEVTAIPTRVENFRKPSSMQQDSAKTTSVDSTIKKADDPAIADSSKKQTPAKQKKIYFTAGLGIQQMVPLAGQSAVPYNKYGRSGSLSDYLPSVYLRMHKGKWFMQAEFRYGAPQSVKEFSFAQRTKYDTATNNLSVTNTVLRKTYYHQIPLTLNYHVHKNVSIGVGGMYSFFYGAVTQQEVRTQNVLTGQESFKTTIVPVRSFNDSFLYKSQVHLLVQADYHWKRFNLGLRYSSDLQPYIKYTLPDGSVRTEKNHSLQLFVRYRLFEF